MDTVPKFVQLIKLVQQEVGMGNARVRPPRLELEGAELEDALRVIRARSYPANPESPESLQSCLHDRISFAARSPTSNASSNNATPLNSECAK